MSWGAGTRMRGMPMGLCIFDTDGQGVLHLPPNNAARAHQPSRCGTHARSDVISRNPFNHTLRTWQVTNASPAASKRIIMQSLANTPKCIGRASRSRRKARTPTQTREPATPWPWPWPYLPIDVSYHILAGRHVKTKKYSSSPCAIDNATKPTQTP